MCSGRHSLLNFSTIELSSCLLGFVFSDEYKSTVDTSNELLEFRVVTLLKEQFFGVRALFTKAYSRWTVTEQNNPEACMFQKFCTPAPNSTSLSPQGQVRVHHVSLYVLWYIRTRRRDS